MAERKGVLIMIKMSAAEKALAEAVGAHYAASTGNGNVSRAVRHLLKIEALRLNGGWPKRSSATTDEGKLHRLAVVLAAKAKEARAKARAESEARRAAKAAERKRQGANPVVQQALLAGWKMHARTSYKNREASARAYLSRKVIKPVTDNPKMRNKNLAVTPEKRAYELRQRTAMKGASK